MQSSIHNSHWHNNILPARLQLQQQQQQRLLSKDRPHYYQEPPNMGAKTRAVWLVLSWMAISQVQPQENTCVITDSSDCSIGSLTGRTLVYPGGNTSCFYSNETFPNPFAFQVDPGTENKIVFYLQGGGNCASTSECFESTLLPPSSPKPTRNGIFDKKHRLNPLANWTIIAVLYCSGDYHVGQARTPDGLINFQGRNNVLAAWNWVKTNIPNPERVIVSGCSAASIGMMYWSNPILQYYSNLPGASSSSSSTILTALFDGHIGGAVPPVHLRAKQSVFNMCSATDFGWTDEQYQECLRDNFSPNDAQRAIQAAQRQKGHSAALFAFVSYKNDSPQRMSACNNGDQPSPSGCPITQAQHYALNQQMLLNYTEAAGPASSNNVLSYLINGAGHCLLHRNEFYRVDNNRNQPTLVEFLRQMATRKIGTTLSSSCDPKISWRRHYDYSCDPTLTAAQFTQT